MFGHSFIIVYSILIFLPQSFLLLSCPSNWQSIWEAPLVLGPKSVQQAQLSICQKINSSTKCLRAIVAYLSLASGPMPLAH